MYEGGIRVPFIASWQGKIKPGTSNETGAFWDLYPTFQQLAGLLVSKQVDGISMMPALMRDKNQSKHSYYYWEFHENGGRQAVRIGDWKGIKLNVFENANSPLELYNLKTDPSETNNVAANNAAVVKEIETIMQQAHTPDKKWPLLSNELKK